MLLADVSLSALVNSVAWLERPRAGSLPAIVLQIISGPASYTYSGRATLQKTKVQCDIYAEHFADAVGVERAVTTVVAAARLTVGVTWFEGFFIEARRDGIEAIDDAPKRLFRISIDLNINHREA